MAGAAGRGERGETDDEPGVRAKTTGPMPDSAPALRFIVSNICALVIVDIAATVTVIIVVVGVEHRVRANERAAPPARGSGERRGR